MTDLAPKAVEDSPKTVEAPKEVIADAIAEVPAVKAPETPAAPKDAPLETKTENTDAEKVPEVKSVVPEKYNLKLPENSLLKAEELESISSYAREKGLSNEHAQLLVERENAALQRYQNHLQEDLKQKSIGWIDQIKTDVEIGGEPTLRNLELAKRVFQKFGSDTLMKTLNETGLGNHPELVRMGVRLGKAMSEDQLVLGSQTAPQKKSLAEKLYGGSTPK